MITQQLIESYEGLKFEGRGLDSDVYRGDNGQSLWYDKDDNIIEMHFENNHLCSIPNIETDDEFILLMKMMMWKTK